MDRARKKQQLKETIEKQSRLLNTHPMLVTQKFLSDLDRHRQNIEKKLKSLEEQWRLCNELWSEYSDEIGKKPLF